MTRRAPLASFLVSSGEEPLLIECDRCGEGAAVNGREGSATLAELLAWRAGHVCDPAAVRARQGGQRKLRPCGTEPAYRRHLKRGEKCAACMAGMRKASAKWAARKKSRRVLERPTGD